MTDPPTPSPRYSTPRRPERPTFGAEVAGVAEVLGQPLLPWQRHVADVALEVDPDRRRLAYRRVSLGVPRRAGKSYLILCLLLWRAHRFDRQRLWYTAQNGTNITKLWRQEWWPLVESSPAARGIGFRASQGHEEFTDHRTRSFISAFSPKRDALHSQAGDVVVFDEAWTFTSDEGADLMQAAAPLLMTRRDAQLYFVSAAGDTDSEWWLELLDAGRTAASVDLGHGTCHVEWTAEGDDRDLDDPDLWQDTHPAVGHTIELDDLADERRSLPDLFARQYLNVTDRTGGRSAPIDLEAWLAGHRLGDELELDDVVTLGVDVAVEQTAAAVASCRMAAAGTAHVELVEYRDGVAGLAARVAELVDLYDAELVALDPSGPAGVLVKPLEELGVPIVSAGSREVAAASASMAAAVAAGHVTALERLELDEAVAAAHRLPVGDGAWKFSRRLSDADVSPLIAATLARWAHPDVYAAYGANIY